MLKNRKKLLLIGVCALLAAQIFLFFWLQSPVQSQSGTSTAVVVTKPQPAPVVNNSPLFTALRGAAAENSRLRNNLNWTFGNKQQRGWNLYIPLVQRLIGSENTPDS
ncbi:MAG TPA: hypothetical protein VEX64_00735, partial [Pyrinomonadaceae bacterium]|nr:hypothetical protein [Pyrinomonadaceae bacterium]